MVTEVEQVEDKLGWMLVAAFNGQDIRGEEGQWHLRRYSRACGRGRIADGGRLPECWAQEDVREQTKKEWEGVCVSESEICCARELMWVVDGDV